VAKLLLIGQRTEKINWYRKSIHYTLLINKKAKKMVKIKQQEYTEPTVKVVAFIVEKGFEMSGDVFENIEEGQDISGNDNDPNALVRWQ
jgi:hypothetical protein